MQFIKVSFVNPIGQGVLKLTNWLVSPLQRILPRIRLFDLPTLLAAFLCSLVHLLILWGVLYLLKAPNGPATHVASFTGLLLYVSLLNTLKLFIYLLSFLIIANVALSWLRPDSPHYWLTFHLCAPLLNPLRKFIPTVANFDFSPLVALVILQIILIIANHL